MSVYVYVYVGRSDARGACGVFLLMRLDFHRGLVKFEGYPIPIQFNDDDRSRTLSTYQGIRRSNLLAALVKDQSSGQSIPYTVTHY